MDAFVLRPELYLRLKVAKASIRYYGDYVLFEILLEYRWAGDWHLLTQRTIRLNISQQMIIQEQIALDQLKAVQTDRYNEESLTANFPEQIQPTHPTDYFEAIHAIVQKMAKKYFETKILPAYSWPLNQKHTKENIQIGLKAVLKVVEMSNSFGR